MSRQMARKKDWSKPELIVLLRNRPEEAVLVACKGASIPASVAGLYNGCSDIGVNCDGQSVS